MDGATRARLRIRNGYQKSHSLFLKNTRVKDATLKLLPGGTTTKVTLADKEGWQEVVVEQPAGKLTGIELTVATVYPGTKYTDLCISDIQVFVTAETPENPTFEKSKLDKVLAWKAERLAAAKAFAAGARELPFLASYQLHERDDEGKSDYWDKCGRPEADALCWLVASLDLAGDLEKGHHDAFAVARQALAAKELVPGRLAPADARVIPPVDGLYVPGIFGGSDGPQSGGLALPIADLVAALEANKMGALQVEGADVKAALWEAAAAKAPGCSAKEGRLYTWLLREKIAGGAEAGRSAVRAALFVRCARLEMRDGPHNMATTQLAVYDAAGHLELTVGTGYVASFSWTKDGDHDVIAGGKALYADGRVAELRR
jgi:hypothetical protein